MEPIWEKARDVGRLLAQSEEYKALKRANTVIGDDRETVTLLNQLERLEGQITQALQSGQEPEAGVAEEYERIGTQVQARPAYREMELARINFDKVMMRIHEEIARGLQAGEQSRIILPS
jgi:cell fate (sporulation/competence/biofilm development) regulator YlbF (YheA/YmcA/DUF963 family)